MANTTAATGSDVATFVAGIEDEGQRADAGALIELMADATGEPPAMWGSAIIGFGRYTYRYDSGREGESARISFSPRKGKTTLYLAPYYAENTPERARLGKHKLGKGCLYVQKLSDIDMGVLRELVDGSLAEIARRHPAR